MIEVENVYKKLGEKEVLKDINLSLEKASIYGLLGPNGSGKTTLLNIISDIYSPDNGEVKIMGEKVYNNIKIKNKMLYMRDKLIHYRNDRVKDIEELYRRSYQNWSQEKFDKLFSNMDIENNNRINSLSKGNKTQLYLILNLSTMPELLLLDEPLSGLDAVKKNNILKTLLNEVIDRNMTILISSHSLNDIEKICDKIGFLFKGKIVIEDEIEELKKNINKIQVAFNRKIDEKIFNRLNIINLKKIGNVYEIVVKNTFKESKIALESENPIILERLDLSLEDIFIKEMEELGYD